MKTTLSIDDNVMKKLRQEAARRDTTMSELVEAGLRLILTDEKSRGKRKKLPILPVWSSGGALVDIANKDQLYNRMDGE